MKPTQGSHKSYKIKITTVLGKFFQKRLIMTDVKIGCSLCQVI